MYNFKSFFFLAVAASFISQQALAAPENVPKEKLETIAKCQKENNFNGNVKDLDFSSDVSKNVKCFMACILTEEKIMTPEGSIDVEAGTETFKKMFANNPEKLEKITNALKKCSEEVKVQEDKCETGFEFVKCKMAMMKD